MSENLYQRGRTWWARFTVLGVEYRRSLRTPVRAEAKRRLEALKKQVDNEARFNIPNPRSFADAIDSWSKHETADLNAKTVKRYLTSLKQVWRHLAHLDVHRIDTGILRDMIKARRVEGATTATIKRDLTAISAVLNHAIAERWTDANPALAIKLKEKRDPIVLPARSEIEAVKAKCPPRFADAIDFAIETGMRLEEIFDLRHRQIGTDAITVERAKHRGLRVIPLTARARKIIERQPRHIKLPHVFRQEDGKRWATPSSSFRDKRAMAQKAAQKEGVEFVGFRFHDLRHLFAVQFLKQKRGTIYDLQQVMGHSSIKTTEDYLKYLTPDEQRFARYGDTKLGTDAAVCS